MIGYDKQASKQAGVDAVDARGQGDGVPRQRGGALVDLLQLPVVALGLPDAQGCGARHLRTCVFDMVDSLELLAGGEWC